MADQASYRGDGGADRRGEGLRDLPCRALGNEGGRGERDQLVPARGEAGPQEADPQRQMLDERNGPGDTPGDDRPDDDLGQRQERHRRQRAGGEHLFRPMEEPKRWLHTAFNSGA